MAKLFSMDTVSAALDVVKAQFSSKPSDVGPVRDIVDEWNTWVATGTAVDKVVRASSQPAPKS